MSQACTNPAQRQKRPRIDPGAKFPHFRLSPLAASVAPPDAPAPFPLPPRTPALPQKTPPAPSSCEIGGIWPGVGGAPAHISPLRPLPAGLAPARIGGRGAAGRRPGRRRRPTGAAKSALKRAAFPTKEA